MGRKRLIVTFVTVAAVVAVVAVVTHFAGREEAYVDAYAVSEDGLTLYLHTGYPTGSSLTSYGVTKQQDDHVEVEVWSAAIDAGGPELNSMEILWVTVQLDEPLGTRAVTEFGRDVPEGPYPGDVSAGTVSSVAVSDDGRTIEFQVALPAGAGVASATIAAEDAEHVDITVLVDDFTAGIRTIGAGTGLETLRLRKPLGTRAIFVNGVAYEGVLGVMTAP